MKFYGFFFFLYNNFEFTSPRRTLIYRSFEWFYKRPVFKLVSPNQNLTELFSLYSEIVSHFEKKKNLSLK